VQRPESFARLHHAKRHDIYLVTNKYTPFFSLRNDVHMNDANISVLTRVSPLEHPRSDSRSRRTQADRRSEAEARMLEAATQLVARKGLERFTLAEVGELAGYSKGLPGHYYGSKKKMITMLAGHLVARFDERFRAQPVRESGLERLVAIIRFYFRSVEDDPEWAKAVNSMQSEAMHLPAIRELVAGINRNVVGMLHAQLESGIRKKQINPKINCQAHALLILSAMRGASIQWVVDPSVELKLVCEEFISSMVRALKASTADGA
jgi:AcrR family transcriptional regulator